MGLFKSYLKARAKVIAVFILVAAAFSASFLLFEMPSIVVIYPLALSLLICVLAAALDFRSYRDRHMMLVHEELPVPASLLEEDYQQIITGLQEDAIF